MAMRALLLGSIALLSAEPLLARSEPQPAPAETAVVQGSGALAVTRFSARDLEVLGATDLLGVSVATPGMVAANLPGLGSGNGYFLRGLGTTDTLPGSNPAVGVFVDGIVLPRVNGNNPGLFDVASAEVVRGSEGALFGRNVTGGAIAVRMARPGDTVSGQFEAGYGAHDRWQLRGSVDIPLDRIAAIKLSAFLQDDRGYARNAVTGENLNDGDRAGLRLGLRLEPAAGLSWNAAVSYIESNGENLMAVRCGPADPADCGGRRISTGMVSDRLIGGVPQYSVPVTGRKANFALGNALSTTLVTSDLEWAGDRVRLNLLTGYVSMEEAYALDFGDGRGLPDLGTPRPVVRGFIDGGRSRLTDGSHSQFSQEVRLSATLGPVELTLGGLYLTLDEAADVADIETLENGTATGVPVVLGDRFLTSSTTAKAGYADATWRLLDDRLTLSAGVRFTDETKRFAVAERRAACAVTPGAADCLDGVQPVTVGTQQWTPRAAATFGVTDGVQLFASAARGYRAGAWNGEALRRDAVLATGPETAWTYQAGVTSDWLDGRLRLNLTGFLVEVDGLQAPMALVDPQSGVVTAVTGDAGGYRNSGAELSLTAVPLEGLTIGLDLVWQSDSYRPSDALGVTAAGLRTVRQQQADCQAELASGLLALAPDGYRAGSCALGLVAADGSLATPIRTPDLQFALHAAWDLKAPKAGVFLTPGARLRYRGEMETAFGNGTLFSGASGPAFDGTVFPANALSGDVISGSAAASAWLLDASLEVRTDDGFWRLALSCENCLDRAATEASLYGYSYLTPPRTWLVSARRRF
jgi:iron complex outermembrane receptor protein